MSTEVMEHWGVLSSLSSLQSIPAKAVDRDPVIGLSRVHFEVVYEALYAPEAEPEEIRQQYYLLECD